MTELNGKKLTGRIAADRIRMTSTPNPPAGARADTCTRALCGLRNSILRRHNCLLIAVIRSRRQAGG